MTTKSKSAKSKKTQPKTKKIKKEEIHVKCIELSVRATDEADNNLPGYQARFSTHGGSIITDYVKLPPDGAGIIKIQSYSGTSYIDLLGPGNPPNQYFTKHRISGVKEDTHFVFIFHDCS